MSFKFLCDEVGVGPSSFLNDSTSRIDDFKKSSSI